MEDAAIYTSFILNILCAILLIVSFLSKIRKQILTVSSAKTRYSFCALGIGVVSGIVFFPGLIYLYELAGWSQSLGHGVVFILALISNFPLAVVMAVVGRVVLGWKPMQW